MLSGLNLLIPDKVDAERDALAAAFVRQGGLVYRLDRFWEPPLLKPSSVRVYGPDAFCLVLQQKLGLTLHSPGDKLLLSVPREDLGRTLSLKTLGSITPGSLPAFVKPVVPKLFRAGVYSNVAALNEECRGLASDTAILVSEIVRFAAEVRCFVLGNRVLDAALYEGNGIPEEAAEFVTKLAQRVAFPRAVVVDVGLIPDSGWAVVEFNACWGAGLNGCRAELVLPAIMGASGG